MRYVVLHHTGYGPEHFDLMLERPDAPALRTFRLPCWPVIEPVPIVELGDHRLAYLEHEGAVPGDRGWVRRVSRGTAAQALAEADALRVELVDEQSSRSVRIEIRIDQTAAPWSGQATS